MNQIYIWKILLNQEWLAIFLTFIILNFTILALPLFRKSRVIFALMIIIVNLRFILIFINLYIIKLPGSDQDAVRFVRNANSIAQGNIKSNNFIGADLFEYYLSFIIKFISNNFIYLHLLSNIFFILCIYIFILFLNNLKVNNKYILISLIILNLFPSVLMNTVTVLREAYQMFFLLLSTYSLYRYISKEKFINLLIFILSSFFLGISHNGLIMVIPIIILMGTITFIWEKDLTIKSLTLTFFSLFITLGVFILMKTGILTSQATDSIFTGEGLKYASGYRLSSPDARTTYKGVLDTSNIFTILISSTLLFLKYMFFPLPWMISSVIDLISIFENITRLLIIVYIIKSKITSKILISLFLFYLLLELLWSIGTSNWGTASRHHIVSMPILLVIFSYVFSKSKVRE